MGEDLETLRARLMIFVIAVFVALWVSVFAWFGVEAGLRMGIAAPVVIFGAAAVICSFVHKASE